ncbi:ElyC/SanA/YdcF family protein [Chlorogloeopsis sp. ULAP01]|uniref:SanA/YdcF family protein n=1 Tax=Chlorogloeopsis sp. ULAP01 TaxID=3056483 RepID=UPI0025AB39A1|nr:ElyC/SanA/YdcF family protein [Chlorogloeopsis sp. ULAP01]MDM9382773.1 ElyC/SanA/YdcF family protein [Chlorogloeopsis sp. ULAP01]
MLLKWFLLHWRFLFWLLPLSAIITTLGLNFYVKTVTSNHRYTNPTEVPTQRVAIVLGAGVYPDGTPSPMLSDRITAAVELYKLGRVQKLLMTGDNSSDDYDEVTVMQRYAVERGVPIEDITLDHAGFSTYESCYRAKEIFGIEQAVLVTQKFHLPRAVYTCRQLGVDAIALGTPDWESYRPQTIMYYNLREMISTLKALWEVHITRPLPTFLGPFEGIK